MSGDLEKRIQAIEDKMAIQETINNYGHFIDYGRNDEWLDLWTDDAIYKITKRDKTIPMVIVPQPESGLDKEGMKGYISGHPNAPDAWHKHCLSGTQITLESDTEASAVSYFFRLDEVNNATAAIMAGWAYILAFGVYKDKFVKCDDGKWRFKERYVSLENDRPVPR